MSFLDKLLRTEQKIQARVDQAFGAGAAQTPLETRRAILEHLEDRIVSRAGRRVFPFDRIEVHLLAPEGDAREILAAAFVDDDSLAHDVRQLLLESKCDLRGGEVDVVVDFREPDPGAETAKPFKIECSRAERRARPERRGAPRVELTILKGEAEQPVYRLQRERIKIGRLKEVLDKEGQVVRRNDIVFLDNGDDINVTVGRAHATIFFEAGKGEHRIIDEVSRYGTRVFRDGRSIEVPSGNPRGIRLIPGDEIYLGQACLNFNPATES